MNLSGVIMSVVKVIEVICEGKSIEEAMNNGVKEACKTLNHIRQIDVKWIHAHVENGRISSYRVNAKISFVIEHQK
jgi:dodecin